MIRNIFKYEKPLNLESGASLPEIEICYHTSHENVGGRKVIWICHALTANSDPSEWWDKLVGPDKYLDTNKYFIVCANILSSCYCTTGPQSINPQTHKPYLLDFPVVSIRDMVVAHELLRAHLGIDKIDLLIGGSSGGFQAVEWAISNPSIIDNLCILASNARISPWGTAYNESQRMALLSDPEFERQSSTDAGKKGLEAARSIALLSYRTFEGYQLSQAEEDDDCFIATKSGNYQRYQGKKLSERFNPYSYYYLTIGLDTHNVGRKRGGVANALKKITAKTLCIAIDSDNLFPVCEMEEMASTISGASLEIISSPYGHDGFLLEYKQIEDSMKKHIKI